jgi:hypothetical protein
MDPFDGSFSMRVFAAISLVLLSTFRMAQAEEAPPSNEAIAASIEKSLPLLEKGAKGSLDQRKQCFNCHNQGLPIMALTIAQSRGFSIDTEHLKQQVQFTSDFLARNQQRYFEGHGQGGQVDTAGFALWALDLGGWKPDKTTAAVAEYFLLRQRDLDHYEPDSNRPPSEQSFFTSTYVALRGLKVFGTPEQQERIQTRIDGVRKWVLTTSPQDTEDKVFRLRVMSLIHASPGESRQAVTDLKAIQRADGGWAQRDDMQSDVYATGSAMVALHQAGEVSTDDPVYRKGLTYLLSNQLEDGSWHVISRSKPIQTYFESGYPHGKDQFISMSAASWSTTALALALPKRQIPLEIIPPDRKPLIQPE